MTREEVINLISKKIKLVRVESGYTQNKMADIIGVSKKTLVQIEKERIPASWTIIVAICALFKNSEIIRNTLGEDPLEILQVIAHQSYGTPKERTLGGKVWWKEIENKGGFKLQKNVISGHYRLLDKDNYRWLSTFDKDEAVQSINDLANKNFEE
jgi:DNA-binding XRE family transcriptional regulator